MTQSHPISVQIANLDIRGSEKFCNKPHNTISPKKPDSQLPWIAYMIPLPQKYEKQDNAFEEGL